MDPDAEVTFEFVPVIRQYKSGCVERLLPVNPVPPSVDAATGVASKDVTLDPATGLCARLYLPDPHNLSSPARAGASDRRLPIVVYFHGGGWVAGSAADAPEHAFVNRLASRAGALAVSVEYRLAPEHPVPACYDDAWAALRWVLATKSPAADPCSCSVSASARTSRTTSPSASAPARTRSPSPTSSPAAPGCRGWPWCTRSSCRRRRRRSQRAARQRSTRGCGPSWRSCGRSRAAEPGNDPRVYPLADGAPSLRRLGCGRVLVCVAEDALAAEGKAYYDALLASGWAAADAELLDSAPGDHGFHLREPECAKAVLLMDRLVALITGN